MCGIAGIISDKPLPQQARDSVFAMQRALRHRGPDDAGLWTSSDGLASFAHARLSILDLSSAGHQPMSTPDGRFTITFNGEIYNFKELRAQLERDGIVFHTGTDTEVILRLYEKKGVACLPDLRGMFAFAIWDAQEKRGFLARDRFGIKPLCWAERDGVLVFASELRALLASGLVEKKLSPDALAHYFETGSVPEPFTLARDARMLEAGCSIEWSDGKIKPHRWWSIRFSGEGEADPAAAAKSVRTALLDSVEHHFVSDVPVGIFLSGGIDSTALLALARATGRDNVRTFSIGVDDPALDESSVARRSAEHFKAEHDEARVDAARGRELFNGYLSALDQPSIDGFNTFCVSALARERGMKVVLSGLGGDELFAGYPTFARLPRLWRQVRFLGPLRKFAGIMLERLGPKLPLERLGSAMRAEGDLRGLYKAFRGIFSKRDARRLVRHFGGNSMPEEFEDTPRPEAQPTASDEISALELTHYMRNQLLRDSDIMSMAHGLELRVPLVDSKLFDSVSHIPAGLRLQQGKKLLLEAVPEIPDWVSKAPKRGFLFPYQQWLDTEEWKPCFDQALRGLPASTESWYQRWCIFVFRRSIESLGLA